MRRWAWVFFLSILTVACGGTSTSAFGGSTNTDDTGTQTGGGASGPAGGSGQGGATSTHAGGSGGATSTHAGGSGQGGATSTQAGGAGQGGAAQGGQGQGGQKPQVLVIAPAPIQLKVDDQNLPKQAVKALVNGADVTAQTTWTFTRPEIGDIDAAGTFTPTGKVGGIGKLLANWKNLSAETTVEVFVTHVNNEAGLSSAQMASFDAPVGPDPSMSVVYPLDQTVFPLAVLAPELQWNGTQNGDVYRLQLTEKYYTYTAFFSAPPPGRKLVPQADWDSVESSGAGAQVDPLSMKLARQSNGQTYQPATQTWHVAQGRLHGSIYYWELPDQCGNGNGRILRIKPDSDQPDEFFQPGGCFGCHTVSRNGKRMAAEFSNGNGPLYTVALDQNPAAYGELSPQKPSGNYIFSAFNDAGDKLLASDNTASNPAVATLKIVDAIGGAVLNPNAMGTGCGEPAWSPDGKMLAGICGLGGGGWVFDASSGYLAVADVAPDGVTVSNTRMIVPQAGGAGRPAYPSFSPDSKYLAYGRPTQGSRSTANGSLWLTSTDGLSVQQLANADDPATKSFNPVFAPLRAGGYYWIVFITRRDYGNRLVGANRQQLWITAIDDPPTPGVDPSHPPFYVRGQEDCGKSENAYYALDPCKAVGEGCQSGVDCCNGQCLKDPQTGQLTCGDPPPPGQCSAEGNSCKVDGDCCDKVDLCIDGFCQPKPHK
jgi:hypothetical protein